MQLQSLKFALKDGVAHVTLAQPERGNPFDRRFAAEMNEVATECSANPDVRAVLIDAEGRFFSVGGDLHSLTESRPALARFVSAATSNLHMAVSRFARMNAPVVMAINAMAAGGGVALAAGADFVLAGPDARFYAAFLGIGIIADTGGTYLLPRRMGTRRAAEFLMLNETLTAEEALRDGLVTRVVEADRLDAEAWTLASRLAQGPTTAFGELKNLLISSSYETLESQLELEARAMARVTTTDDAWNAMNSVKTKRKPSFSGH